MELVKQILQITQEFSIAILMIAGAVWALVHQIKKSRRDNALDDLTDKEKKHVSEASSWLLTEMQKQFGIQNGTIDLQSGVIKDQATKITDLHTTMWTQIGALQTQLAAANRKAGDAVELLRRVKRASDDLIEGGHIDERLAPLTDFLRDDPLR